MLLAWRCLDDKLSLCPTCDSCSQPGHQCVLLSSLKYGLWFLIVILSRVVQWLVRVSYQWSHVLGGGAVANRVDEIELRVDWVPYDVDLPLHPPWLLSNYSSFLGNIKHRWRILSGQHHWENLLNPLDSDLQQYILHYGAMAQSTYDTFNSNKLSRYAGSSLYTRRDLFSKVGLVYANPYKYKAVKFLYATSRIGVPEGFICKSRCEDSWCKKSNWMGYVAVATDEGKAVLGRRDILVAWRGTSGPIEWAKDLEFPLVPVSKILGRDAGDAQVHQGFLSIYTSDDQESAFNKTSARDQYLTEFKRFSNGNYMGHLNLMTSEPDRLRLH